MRVMLVDDNARRAALVEASLQGAGFAVLATIPTGAGLLFQLERQRPDVVIIALESPDRDVLESLAIVSSHNPLPVVMFSEQQDPDFIAAAVRAGVTAYQVEGINPSRVKAAIDVAILQFRAFAELRRQLDDTRRELSERKQLARATGLLMAQHGASEEEAFSTLRKLAMDTNLTLADAAGQVIRLLGSSKGRPRP